MMYGYSNIVSGQCGIGTWADINNESTVTTITHNSYGQKYDAPRFLGQNGNYVVQMLPGKRRGGCGFSGTGFIANELCKEAYEYMCSTFRLVFQTPVRRNNNSGNLFFYAMFDDNFDEDSVASIGTIKANWPFKDVK